MSQQDELARVKARIKTLAERTVQRGCTEAEAMAAAEMVGRLLERYAVTMNEVDVRETPCTVTRVPAGGLRRRPIDACVPALAGFCDCKVWLAREPAPPAYVFFGFETDTAIAFYLCRACRCRRHARRSPHGRSWKIPQCARTANRNRRLKWRRALSSRRQKGKYCHAGGGCGARSRQGGRWDVLFLRTQLASTMSRRLLADDLL